MFRRWIDLLAAESKEDRRSAAEALVPVVVVDAAATDAVRAALSDRDAHRRWGATFVLYRAGVRDAAVFRGALEALGESDGDVRWSAAEIVVALVLADPSRRQTVAAEAASPMARGRKMALYCLRELGGEEESVFARALEATDAGVRLAAVSCFARMSRLSERGVDALLGAVECDLDPGVRRAATVALRKAVDHAVRVRPILEHLCATATDSALVRAAEIALAALP